MGYEQIPFKCRLCHGYGHFSHNYKKKSEDEIEHAKDAQWTQVQKAGTSQGPRKKGKEKTGTRNSLIGKNPPQAVDTSNGHSNHFVVLGSSKDILKEGELQQIDGLVMETEVIVTPYQAGPSFSNPPGVGESTPVPIGDISPPSYADIAHKKSIVGSGSSDEDSIESVLQNDRHKV